MYLVTALFGVLALVLLVFGQNILGASQLSQQIEICYNTSDSAEARLDCVDQAYLRALFGAQGSYSAGGAEAPSHQNQSWKTTVSK
jgi:hypothetical protein